MSGEDEITRRVRRQVKLHGESSLNNLDKWRWDNIRAADKRAAERRVEEREHKRQQEQNQVEVLRAEMQQQLATLRAEIERQHETLIEATGEALGQYGDKIIDRSEEFVKNIQRE